VRGHAVRGSTSGGVGGSDMVPSVPWRVGGAKRASGRMNSALPPVAGGGAPMVRVPGVLA
jgi:hypothetical protein